MNNNIHLPQDWQIMVIDNKYCFVNLKIGIITYNPPIQLNNLDIFLKAHNFKISREEFIKEMESIKVNEDKSTKKVLNNNQSQNKQKENFNLDNFCSPQNSLKILSEEDFMSGEKNNEKEPLHEKVEKLFMEKFKIKPNYGYFIKEESQKIKYFCSIRYKNKVLITAESEISKNKAREETMKMFLTNFSYSSENLSSPLEMLKSNYDEDKENKENHQFLSLKRNQDNQKMNLRSKNNCLKFNQLYRFV
jgi:hypothetical protein